MKPKSLKVRDVKTMHYSRKVAATTSTTKSQIVQVAKKLKSHSKNLIV